MKPDDTTAGESCQEQRMAALGAGMDMIQEACETPAPDVETPTAPVTPNVMDDETALLIERDALKAANAILRKRCEGAEREAREQQRRVASLGEQLTRHDSSGDPQYGADCVVLQAENAALKKTQRKLLASIEYYFVFGKFPPGETNDA